MGSVLNANSKPVAHRDKTVETTTTQSCNLLSAVIQLSFLRLLIVSNLSWRLHYKYGQDEVILFFHRHLCRAQTKLPKLSSYIRPHQVLNKLRQNL